MKAFFKGQLAHLIFLLILLWVVYHVISTYPAYLDGSLWGMSTMTWIYIALAFPIVHQTFVWICWRLEYPNKHLSRILGEKAFQYYKIDFSILILGRPVSILLLGIANYNSLPLDPSLAYLFAIVFALPAVYLMYSIRKYFGFDRAYGLDHFEPEKMKNESFVREGIFKWTPNAMYVFGFMMLYAIAFATLSKAALMLAVFNHLYIWVHYYFTEKPDMNSIYEN